MYIIARFLLFRFHLIVIVGVVLCAHTQELYGGDHEVLITDDEDFDDGSSLYITTPSPTAPTTEDPYYVTDEYTGTYPTDVTTEVGTTTEDSEIVTPTEEFVVSGGEKKYNHETCGDQFNVGKTNPFFKIVGGSTSQTGAWPWQIGLLQTEGSGIKPKFNEPSFCGGTIINSRTVVTAAHCFLYDTGNTRYFVRVGDNDWNVEEDQEKIIAVSEVISHEGYDENTVENDIALLILAEELTLKDKVNAACLPDVDEPLSPCVVSGWGDLEEEGNASPILQEAEVPIVSHKKCNKACIEEYGQKTITDKMLCAGYTEGGIDSCQGDSGGPLVCKNNKGKYILRGVVSFGAGCARAERYGVYTKVHRYMDWIKQNMR